MKSYYCGGGGGGAGGRGGGGAGGVRGSAPLATEATSREHSLLPLGPLWEAPWITIFLNLRARSKL